MEEIIDRNVSCEPSELGKKRYTYALVRFHRQFDAIFESVMKKLGITI